LRERGDDVVLLAQSFAERFGRKLGRSLRPLTPADVAALKSYAWPGNVRELQNVIERAVITSVDGALNLRRALPEASQAVAPAPVESTSRIWTARELDELERQNYLRALELAGWRVAGENGAAQLLGINSSTFTSRMKALAIKRPRTSS